MEKIKPNYDDLKSKNMVELVPVMTKVLYYKNDACLETIERFLDPATRKVYEHRQVMPMTDEQLKKVSISLPARVLKSEFTEISAETAHFTTR